MQMTKSSHSNNSVTVYQSMYTNQQGVALIVVLLFLILIMLAGVIAVRQSNTDLKTATADQINTVLLQSADSANEKLESGVNGSPDAEEYRDLLSVAGVFGYFLSNPDHVGQEFSYCFNPRNKNYLLKNATVKNGSGILYDNGGVCDYTNADDYTSDRQTTMTQMNITTAANSASTEAFSQYTIGKDIENRSSRKQKFDIRSTAAIPSYSQPDGCFAKTSIPDTSATPDTIINCLHTKNTPSKMLYTQADLENLSSSTQCTGYGKAGSTGKCTL